MINLFQMSHPSKMQVTKKVPTTTTVSTIAVQSKQTRIVVALLQAGLKFDLKVWFISFKTIKSVVPKNLRKCAENLVFLAIFLLKLSIIQLQITISWSTAFVYKILFYVLWSASSKSLGYTELKVHLFP